MRYGWHDGSGWAAWLAMGFMMVVFWGVVAAAVIFMLRSSGHRHDHDHPSSPPPTQPEAGNEALRILDQRFARGEIELDEYTRRREVLLGAR
jgi:putative membrane protein